jgi:hypothetical protein
MGVDSVNESWRNGNDSRALVGPCFWDGRRAVAGGSRFEDRVTGVVVVLALGRAEEHGGADEAWWYLAISL